jgi:drug/metabolite transporter (DMT)-like permease
MPRREWSLVLILAAIWGSSYLFIAIGLRDMSPMVVAFGRIVLGALVLLPLAWRAGAFGGLRGLDRRIWALLVLIAVIQVAAPFALISEGQEHVTSALAGILVASVPIFSAILAFFFDEEDRSEGLRAVGVLVGIVGVGILFGVDLGDSSETLLGGLLIVLASLGYATGGLLVRQRLGMIQPLGIAATVLAISTVLSLPFALSSAPSELPGAGPLAAVAALGILGTGVAFAIFYSLIARVGPSRTFVVTYLAPGFAVVYGAALLDEEIGVGAIVGLALILAGSYLAAEGRLPGRPAKEPPVPSQPPEAAAVSDPRTRAADPA